MSKLTFFRQSGWMLIATTLSGVMFYLVHYVTSNGMVNPDQTVNQDQYGLFTALLSVLNMMAIPAVGLQLTFVQQAVAAQEKGERAQLAGAARAVLKGTFLFWSACALLVFVFRDSIAADFKISNPWALWATALLGLTSLWSPVFLGILQGRQNFLWLGNASILNAATRLGGAALLIYALGAQAAGAMSAALAGMAVALGVGIWQSRDVLIGPAAPFQWRPWFKRALPVTLGYGAATVILTVDTVVVRRYFPADSTGIYGAAGTVGRAVFFFLAPLTTVMFPKIAQSALRSEKSSVLAQAMGATAFMGIGAALFCTFLLEWPFRMIYKDTYLPALKLAPLFAWCMLPIPLANVLINNLLARERYGVVPWLIGIAVTYYFALSHVAQLQPQKFENVIWTLGAFGLLMLVVCLLYTWHDMRQAKAAAKINA